VLNSVYMIVVTDMRSQGMVSTTMFQKVVERSFAAWYVIEIILKVLVHKSAFCTDPDACWNLFDLVIVLWTVSEIIAELSMKGNMMDLSFVRVMRLLRVAKVLRIFRAFQFLHDLRMMICCLLGSLLPLIWAAILFLLVLLIFSLIFVTCMTEYVLLEESTMEDVTREAIDVYFGSVLGSLITLFKCTTGGEDWGPIHDLVSLCRSDCLDCR